MLLRTVLVDLSGTLHVENQALFGAISGIERLRNCGLNLRFVTNTTKESLAQLKARLVCLGFDVRNDEIFTSLLSARRILQEKDLRPFLMVDENAIKDFEGLDTSNPNAVVVGLAPDEYSYQNMNTAFRLLLDGASLIAIHKGRYYRRSDGLALGPGPFVTALEFATTRKAVVVGKPEKDFFVSAISGFADSDPETTVMIGDDVRDDVDGAQRSGMRGILVKTGKYRATDEHKISPPPAAVCNNFADAVDTVIRWSR